MKAHGIGVNMAKGTIADERSLESSGLEPMMSTPQVAEVINVEPRTLDQWRYTGKNRDALPHFKFGRTVRYRRKDVLAFIAAGRVGGN